MLQVNYLWRFSVSKLIFLFFLPLWIGFLNHVSVLHENTALKSSVVGSLRQLSTISKIVKHYYPQAKLKGISEQGENEGEDEGENKGEDADIVAELKTLTMLRNKVKTGISSRKNIINNLNLYTQFLTKVRKKMMNKLSEELSRIARENGISEKEKKKLWNECEKSIDQQFEHVKKCYGDIVHVYSNARWILGIVSSSVLSNYIKVWESVLFNNEKKWSEIFVQRILQNNSSAVTQNADLSNGGNVEKGKAAVHC
ncbi:RAD protein [Plasmodium cynomolgi strain B]|uniref:RAD protein n=1 Tax=Plasmodium cynomolgi (strain B) TaxID=1120755 RepID=K6V812_PLACD|nr:RAD protein [Plasmodium cynomolgi strain B]GAB65277.1 RAD protein [Plasmodium cynomolgi strain B]